MEYRVEQNRIYAEDDAGKLLAEIRFSKAGETAYTITRTFVDDALRGQGVAGELVKRAVEEIEHRGKTVTATCSYAVRWLEKRREG